MKKRICTPASHAGFALAAGALVALTLCAAAPGTAGATELRLYAGAGLRQPVDRLIESFQEKTSHRVVVDYDGSGRLLARITASGQGDLFMPGSLFFIEKLEKKGGVYSRRSIVAHTPVIAINRQSTATIESLNDLTRPGIKIALGDPKAMALGKTAVTIMERSGLQKRVLPNVTVYGATVKQLALYIAEGTVDVAIIGRTDAVQFSDRVRMLPIPDSFYDPETVAVAVLTTTTDEKVASELRDFLSSASAVKTFEQFGFLPLQEEHKCMQATENAFKNFFSR